VKGLYFKSTRNLKLLLLCNAYPALRPFLLLTLPHQRVGWGCRRSWEGTQLGQLTSADQRDIPDHIMLCSATKAEEKKNEGEGHLELRLLPSQVTIVHDEMLLSWRWLNTAGCQ